VLCTWSALRARAEDHGFVPHQPEETHVDFEIDGKGLPLGDPDRLEEGKIEEEEEEELRGIVTRSISVVTRPFLLLLDGRVVEGELL